MDDIKKKAIFKDLTLYSRHQAGIRAGFDKIYKNKSSVVTAVQRIYEEVKKNPEQFVVSADLVDAVNRAMRERSIMKQPIVGGQAPTDLQIIEPTLNEMEVKELVHRGSQKAWVALNKKLDMTLKNNRLMRQTSISALAQVAGIAFDKRQITRGEATEHISLKAKITENLTPTQKLEMVLSMREKISNPNEQN